MVNFVNAIKGQDTIQDEFTEEIDEHITDGDCGEPFSLMVQNLL